MDTQVEQQFPMKVEGNVVHRRWAVDVKAAARWSGMDAARLEAEVREMAAHFPRWVLTVAVGRQVQSCRKCDGMLAWDRGLRCVQCGVPAAVDVAGMRPAWFGVMPPIGIDALHHVKARLLDSPPRQHVVGQREGLGHYILVPVVASYGRAFPERPVDVFYLPAFAQVGPTEAPSHAVHMLGHGQMCLFAPGDWYAAMSAREVLQQRAFPHVIKFLNHANGKRDAFARVS